MFNKAKEIASGWKGYITKPDVPEETVNNRANICSKCPFAEKMKFDIFTDSKLKQIEHYKCSLCGCPLSPKVRSFGNCPKNKW